MSRDRRRVPQQERGTRRVQKLLDAAAAEFAQVGYDSATMTAIAERAEASIGAVYQYFPNKEALARALRTAYATELENHWAPLDRFGMTVDELVDVLIDVMVTFMRERPAYIPLLNAPISYRRDPGTRHRLRERFAALFVAQNPRLEPPDALLMANVALQCVKGLNSLYADANEAARLELVSEYKQLLRTYLGSRLSE